MKLPQPDLATTAIAVLAIFSSIFFATGGAEKFREYQQQRSIERQLQDAFNELPSKEEIEKAEELYKKQRAEQKQQYQDELEDWLR